MSRPKYGPDIQIGFYLAWDLKETKVLDNGVQQRKILWEDPRYSTPEWLDEGRITFVKDTGRTSRRAASAATTTTTTATATATILASTRQRRDTSAHTHETNVQGSEDDNQGEGLNQHVDVLMPTTDGYARKRAGAWIEKNTTKTKRTEKEQVPISSASSNDSDGDDSHVEFENENKYKYKNNNNKRLKAAPQRNTSKRQPPTSNDDERSYDAESARRTQEPRIRRTTQRFVPPDTRKSCDSPSQPGDGQYKSDPPSDEDDDEEDDDESFASRHERPPNTNQPTGHVSPRSRSRSKPQSFKQPTVMPRQKQQQHDGGTPPKQAAVELYSTRRRSRTDTLDASLTSDQKLKQGGGADTLKNKAGTHRATANTRDGMSEDGHRQDANAGTKKDDENTTRGDPRRPRLSKELFSSPAGPPSPDRDDDGSKTSMGTQDAGASVKEDSSCSDVGDTNRNGGRKNSALPNAARRRAGVDKETDAEIVQGKRRKKAAQKTVLREDLLNATTASVARKSGIKVARKTVIRQDNLNATTTLQTQPARLLDSAEDEKASDSDIEEVAVARRPQPEEQEACGATHDSSDDEAHRKWGQTKKKRPNPRKPSRDAPLASNDDDSDDVKPVAKTPAPATASDVSGPRERVPTNRYSPFSASSIKSKGLTPIITIDTSSDVESPTEEPIIKRPPRQRRSSESKRLSNSPARPYESGDIRNIQSLNDDAVEEFKRPG